MPACTFIGALMNDEPQSTPTHRPVLLVGSFPFETAKEVFDVAGPALAGYAKRLPDGEAQGWIAFPATALAQSPGLVESDVAVRKQPELPEYRLLRIKDKARSGDLTFPHIGYDKIALNSYQSFVNSRAVGNIAPGTRFQVSLPTPFGVIGAYVLASEVKDILPRFEEHYFREVDAIAAGIPAEDLAIQWDIAVEIVAALLGAYPQLRDAVSMDFLAKAVARACDRVPRDVELGLHFCYGNPGGRHIIEPDDTGLMVKFFNNIIEHVKRPVTWVHMPVPKNRDDDAYFAPLRDMRRDRVKEFYLGLVHLGDGVEGAQRRMAAARKYAPYFGVGWECGLRLFPKETVVPMLELHKAVADLA
jgi:hypothetical protein